MKKSLVFTLFIALSFVLLQTAKADVEPGFGGEHPRWTLEDVFGTEALPFAIGHRGYGENSPYSPDTDGPVENTAKAVKRAFREGIQMVEVDAVLSGDGVAVALHDDFLEDGTCVNSLDFDDLKDRLRDVSKLRDILKKARKFTKVKKSNRPSGQVLVEIKTPSPLCDPEDVTIPDLVEAVLEDIEETDMEEQVIIESFSPEILLEVKDEEPEIPRMLAVSILQLASQADIEAAFGPGSVTQIEKDPGGFGLQWAEIAGLYRLPSYFMVQNLFFGPLFGTGSHTVSLDKEILRSMAGSAAGFIWQVRNMYGFNVLVWTITDTNSATTEDEWYTFAPLGVDGIMVDDIPLGLDLEGKTAP